MRSIKDLIPLSVPIPIRPLNTSLMDMLSLIHEPIVFSLSITQEMASPNLPPMYSPAMPRDSLNPSIPPVAFFKASPIKLSMLVNPVDSPPENAPNKPLVNSAIPLPTATKNDPNCLPTPRIPSKKFFSLACDSSLSTNFAVKSEIALVMLLMVPTKPCEAPSRLKTLLNASTNGLPIARAALDKLVMIDATFSNEGLRSLIGCCIPVMAFTIISPLYVCHLA